MYKKSQITFFIILGIIIFAVAGLLFYLKNYVKGKEFSQEKEEQARLLTLQEKYATYMQACLEQTSKQGIALIGMQGAVIWEYQANATKPFLGPKKYDYGQWVLPFQYTKQTNLFDNAATIFNVSYGIYAPDLSLNLKGHPPVPEYPYGFVGLIEDPTEIDKSYVNVFGNIITNPLPPLCDYYGENAPGQKGAVFSCETYDSKRESDNDNIQEYLEKYIVNSFKECVGVESLPEFANSTITIGNITVKVAFAPTSITVDASYPLIVTIANQQTTLSFQTVHTVINVRLKQVHELATHLIEADVNNIFFNIVKDANELVDCKELGKEMQVTTCLKEGMEVIKYRDVCQTTGLCKKYGLYDDIVVIRDTKYLLNGKPYLFAFAIENRYPVLDIIHDYNEEYPDYDIVVEEGQPILIEPKAYDPDEDTHEAHDYMEQRYVYGMWKEDYDEISGVKTIAPAESRFTTSDEYLTTQRSASYTTQIGDKGEHILQIQACDNEGLCDFQNIRILVLENQ